MTKLEVILDSDVVNEYLVKHGLEYGHEEIDAVLLQPGGMICGHAAVLLIGIVDGKRHLFKVSLEHFSVAAAAMVAYSCGRPVLVPQ